MEEDIFFHRTCERWYNIVKKVMWVDSHGFKRCSLVRDDDTDPELGIPVGPPPLDGIMQEIERDLHNELMELGLFSLKDISRSGNALTGAILGAIRTKLINLYKERETKHG